MHFEKESAVYKTLINISRRLNELDIPYAVVGGMAMFLHGYRRFTEDLDLLVTAEGLREIHAKLEGLGYVPPFAGSKHLRDTESGVRVEFLVAGQYPGDGLPKPLVFPDPAATNTAIEGISVLQLPRLVELKLAAGMSGPGRLGDLGDVERMIKIFQFPKAFAEQLHPYVQEKYRELWDGVQRISEAP